MKASIRWLRELVPALHASDAEIAARYTSAGFEVESQHHFGAGLETCVVVAVQGTRPHPKRDNLKLVTIDGGAFGSREVVCGAPNVPEKGGLVVLAPVGTHLPHAGPPGGGGVKIEPRAIGGVTSEGMLCSEVELGIGDDASGLMILEAGSAKPGMPLLEAFPFLKDTILEIGLTPNRPDGLGHIGLAREIAALFGIEWKLPAPRAITHEKEGSVADVVKITIDDGEACPHYGAALVDGVTIAPSPLWARARLASLGVRPISNVVDVTNLVMLGTGHPLHAFDLGTLAGPAIHVRRAKEAEKMRTLDGVDRALTADDLLICDAAQPVALAGVMGGENTEIRATTKRVLLECAYFAPRVVRRTARRHGMHSESSHRFERGIDWGDTARTLAEATALVVELAGGIALQGRVVVEKKSLERATVKLREERITRLLGAPVPMRECTQILERLGLEPRTEKDGVLVTRVPSHRPDIAREVDLIEEVARVRGLEKIHPVLPKLRPAARPGANGVPSSREELLRRARTVGTQLGLSEALVYGFVSRPALEAVGAPPPVVEIVNPLTEAQSVMRTSLLPGLLAAAESAQRHGERDLRLFAIGALFLPGSTESDLPNERLAFAAIVAGERPTWLGKAEPVDVWDAKGLAVGFVERMLHVRPHTQSTPERERPPHLHPRGAATLTLEGKRIGCFGPLHPDVADAVNVAPGMLVIELDLEELGKIAPRVAQYSPISRFPASRRDIALVVKDNVLAGEVQKVIREAAGPLAEAVEIFDRFVGGSVPEGHTSLAYRIVYRGEGRTLTDAEVDAAHANVVSTVGARFGAQLRA